MSGCLSCGQGRLGVVPNRRQINGRSSYASHPLSAKCGQLHAERACACSASLLTGSLAISSGDAVIGPQQSWHPGIHANAGMRRRKNRTIWLSSFIRFCPPCVMCNGVTETYQLGLNQTWLFAAGKPQCNLSRHASLGEVLRTSQFSLPAYRNGSDASKSCDLERLK